MPHITSWNCFSAKFANLYIKIMFITGTSSGHFGSH